NQAMRQRAKQRIGFTLDKEGRQPSDTVERAMTDYSGPNTATANCQPAQDSTKGCGKPGKCQHPQPGRARILQPIIISQSDDGPVPRPPDQPHPEHGSPPA